MGRVSKDPEVLAKKAVYIAIEVDLNGMKDVVGMWVGEVVKLYFGLTTTNII